MQRVPQRAHASPWLGRDGRASTAHPGEPAGSATRPAAPARSPAPRRARSACSCSPSRSAIVVIPRGSGAAYVTALDVVHAPGTRSSRSRTGSPACRTSRWPASASAKSRSRSTTGPGRTPPRSCARCAACTRPARSSRSGVTERFFTDAEAAQRDEPLVTLGDHTLNHRRLDRMSRAEQAGGDRRRHGGPARGRACRAPTLFRPPYGAYDARTLALLRERQMTMVLWSVDSGDYLRPGVDAIVERVLRDVKPGAIVLLHDAGRRPHPDDRGAPAHRQGAAPAPLHAGAASRACSRTRRRRSPSRSWASARASPRPWARRAAAGTAPSPAGGRPGSRAALHLGIELGAEQHDDVRDPQPGEEHDHAAEAAVGLVVGAEVRDVEREQRRGGDPQDTASRPPGVTHGKPGLLDVRAGPVEQRDHEGDDQQQDRPLRRCPRRRRTCRRGR